LKASRDRQRERDKAIETSSKGKDGATRHTEAPYGCLVKWNNLQWGVISPQGFVRCPGGPCGHKAHKKSLVSGLSFALRVQNPQHPPLDPTPTLQE
jgi:hypothetical protein